MIEKTILENLTQNEEYSRRVLPFLQNEYFTDATEKYLFSKISGFISKYNTLPDKNTLTLEIDEDSINEGLHKTSTEYVKNFGEINENIDWLIDTTEKFCQEKAVYNAIMQSIKIIDGKDKKKEKGSIPDILSNALAVSFDDRVGHDYFEDAESRFDFYRIKLFCNKPCGLLTIAMIWISFIKILLRDAVI